MTSATTTIVVRGVGLLLIGLATFRGFKGHYRSEDSAGLGETVNRSENPARFWGLLAVQAAIGVVLAIGLVHP